MQKSKTTIITKLVSFALSLLILFYAIPSIVYAETIDALADIGNGSLFTIHDGSKKIEISLDGAKNGTAGSVTNGEDSEDATELQKMMNLKFQVILIKDLVSLNTL